MPLRMTPAVKRGEHGAPACEHGRWTFAGADFKRGATKWRCPTLERARLREAPGPSRGENPR
jgi:hypothetical protein